MKKVEFEPVKPSEELYNLIDEAELKLNVTEPKTTSLDVSAFSGSLSTKDIDVNTLFIKKTKSEKEESRAAYKKQLNDIKRDLEEQSKQIPEVATSQATAQMFNILKALTSTLVEPNDELILKVQIYYNKEVRLFRKLKEEKDAEKKEKEEKELKNELVAIAGKLPIVAEILALIMFIESIKETINTMKDAREKSPKSYNKSVNIFKSLAKIFGEVNLGSSLETISIILTLLNMIIPLLLLIGAGFNSASDYDAAEAEKASNELEKNNMNISFSESDSNISKWAKNNENDYSYSNENASNENNTSSEYDDEIDNKATDDVCLENDGIDYMNMCITDNSEGLIDIETDAEKIIIEANKKYPLTLHISESQIINKNDIIGYLKDEKIESPESFIVSKIENNIIFGDKIAQKTIDENNIDEILVEIDEMISDAQTESKEKSDIEKLVDKFTDLCNIEETLREYFIYTIFPKVPLNIGINDNLIKYDSNFILDRYEKSATELIDKHKENIEKLGGKQNVEAYLNADNLIGFKDCMLNEKRRFFNEAFDLYENFMANNAYYCNEETENYYLLPAYKNFLNKIDRDTNNNYTLELINIIETFIKEREIIEKANTKDKEQEFNELCNFFLPKDEIETKEYYLYFLNLKENNKLEVDEATKKFKDEDYNYNGLYNYILNLIVEYYIKVNDIAESTTKASVITQFEDNSQISNRLKKICGDFSEIIKIKDSLSNQAKKEYTTLNNFYSRLKTNYLDYVNVYNDSAFDSFKTALCQKMRDVYYKNEKYIHYFIDLTNGTDEDDINNLSEEDKQLAETDYGPQSSSNPRKLNYWVKYCTVASLTHCLLPNYWSTGLVISGASISLPVIYVPITFVDGTVSMLFGLGICGLAIYPMILFLNFGLDASSLLIPLSTLIGKLKDSSKNMKTTQENAYKQALKAESEKLKKENEDSDKEIREIDIEISNAKEEVLSDGVNKQRNKEKREERKKKKSK